MMPAPRMLTWLLLSLLVMVVALAVQDAWPGSVFAVTLYKAHLMALGGWGGYWLDRALFPYDRPHEYLEPEPASTEAPPDDQLQVCVGPTFAMSMLRRAIIVAACLICVGLGA